GRAQHLLLDRRKFTAQLPGDIPVRKQVQLALEQRAVVFGQDPRPTGLLDPDEAVGGGGIERTGVRATAQSIEVSRVAKVFQQQESRGQVLRVDRRHVRPGGGEQRGDLQKRAAILLVRRCVHDDEAAAVGEFGAEVAPEARVRRGGRERAGQRGELRAEPALELDESEIHCDLRRIMTLFALKRRSETTLILPLAQFTSARFAAFLILLCCASMASPQVAAPAKPPKPQEPSTIQADSIEGVAELEVTARGRVEFQREDLTIYAEFLRLNQEFGRIEADGGVRMQRSVSRFFGPRLRYNTRDDTGVFEQAGYILEGENSTMRGTSERIEFLSKDRFRMVKGSFTSCEPGREDWRFEAGEMELDNEKSVATVRDGRLKLFDTTVLPMPYGSFSLDNQ